MIKKKLINLIENKFKDDFYAVPIGTIFSFASVNPPPGAFILNGQIIANCRELFPDFWNWVMEENAKGTIRIISSLNYESEQSSIGMCGGFVVDSENGSVRLPNISNGFIEGSNGNNVGNTIDAGLPNITASTSLEGDTYGFVDEHAIMSGAFFKSTTRPSYNAGAIGSVGYDLAFDASRSNPVYGSSNTVQPRAVCYLICIQVFNTTTSLSNQAAAQLASEMQSKAGINADNFTASGKSKIIDNTFELDWENTIDVPAIETYYQAAKNGILVARGYNGSLFVYSAPEAYNNAGSYPIIGNNCYAVNQALIASCLVTKGDYYIIQSTCSQLYEKKFIPFKNSIAAS